MHKTSKRDRLVIALSNAMLAFASQEYRDMLHVLIRYGMDSLARDSREGLDAPPPWWDTTPDD